MIRVKIILKILTFIFIFLFGYFFLMKKYVYPNHLFSIRAIETYNRGFETLVESDYLVTGDSTAFYSIDPRGISPDSQSRALLASPLLMTEKQLRSLDLTKIKKGLVLTQTFIDEHYHSDIWGLLVPNNLITLEDIELLTNSNQKMSVKISNFVNYILARLYLNEESMLALINYVNLPQKHSGYQENLRIRLNQTAGYLAEDPEKKLKNEQFMLPFFSHFSRPVSPPAGEINAFKKILAQLQARGLKVYFVKTPMAFEQTNVDIKIYQASVDEILKNLSSPNLIVVDGWNWGRQLDRADFIDFSHLNKNGAEKFSHFLRSSINSIQ